MDEGRAEVAGERGEQFGRVGLQGGVMETYFLDLYETPANNAPGLACRGYYARPAVYSGRRYSTIPLGVELSLDDAAFNALYDASSGVSFGEEGSWDPDAPYFGTFVLGMPGADLELVFEADVSPPLRLPDRTVWAGWLGGRGGRVNGEFAFILEQYGTIEPVSLLLVAIFFVVFYDRDGDRQAEECYQQALRMCGDAGNIKSVNATSGVTGMTLRVDRGCQIECFERRPT